MLNRAAVSQKRQRFFGRCLIQVKQDSQSRWITRVEPAGGDSSPSPLCGTARVTGGKGLLLRKKTYWLAHFQEVQLQRLLGLLTQNNKSGDQCGVSQGGNISAWCAGRGGVEPDETKRGSGESTNVFTEQIFPFMFSLFSNQLWADVENHKTVFWI